MSLYFISNRNNYNFTNSNFDIRNIDEEFDIDNQDIYKINYITYEINRITNTPYNESYPIELENNELIYISDESGIRNIYIDDNLLSTINKLDWLCWNNNKNSIEFNILDVAIPSGNFSFFSIIRTFLRGMVNITPSIPPTSAILVTSK